MVKERKTQAEYLKASGELEYGLTNDYMFRALLQENNKVLKGLTCALKRLKPEDVKFVEIENPIILGKALEKKTFLLDVKVCMNNRETINYEMQVRNLKNWPERSLVYLCSLFDRINRGEDYIDVRPVTHIGFLDFALFPERPEFHAAYRMVNVKNGHIYTDKFTLSVINLNRTDLATQEDKEWHVDYWAALFKAKTWEEIRMLAEKDELMEEAANTIYRMSQDEQIREQCFQREEYDRNERTHLREKQIEREMRKKAEAKAKKAEAKAEKAETKANIYLDLLIRNYQTQEKTKSEVVELLMEQTEETRTQIEETVNALWKE